MQIFSALGPRLKRFLIGKIRDLIYWQTQQFTAKSYWLAVTYANDRFTDGAGAQLHRIYGVYAIARLLKVAYIHSPLTRLDYQGLVALENQSSSQAAVVPYNEVFRIPDDRPLPEQFVVRELEEVDLQSLEKLKQEAEKTKTFILARILYPHGLTDRYPNCYQVIPSISPFEASSAPIIRVAVHVRRGELLIVDSDRMLPNAYYLAILQNLRQIFDQLNLAYEFELYTELPQKAFTVTPNHQGFVNRITTAAVVDPQVNKIEEFDVIPHLKKFINTDAIDTLYRMASADVLITSHSSFSYLAAILNPQGIIIFHSFWHSPLKQWLLTDDQGNFSQTKFIKQLQAKERSRSLQRTRRLKADSLSV